MTNPFSDLLERSVKPSRLVVGLMSGTSADSIDVAICRLQQGQGTEIAVELVHYSEHPHDAGVQAQVQRAALSNLRALAELNVLLGEAFAAPSCDRSRRHR